MLACPLHAVLFDFDETMIDLEAQHESAHRALCTAHGADYDALPESFRFGSGRRIVDDIDEMRRFFGWSDDPAVLAAVRYSAFVESCRTSELELLPGVEKIVRAAATSGLKLAVTTSADGGPVDEILRRFGLRELFTVIVAGDEVTIGKPDPQAYLLTAAKLAVEPRHCLVFEDSSVGVRAAKRAGMFCIAVRNPNARERQDLRDADVIVGSFEEIDPELFSGRDAER